ncbi:ATP-binding protein [Rubrivivax sp. RP6-9]|uniref:ATP-binding protein n=1 Tax=Rubrivivax sp. RP6-9 TaxID=3415750 RepID=UPI003CC6121B
MHPHPHLRNLPEPPAAVFGLETALERLDARLAGHRLVTLVGAGGLGKTTLAMAYAAFSRPRFPGGVGWVDLAAQEGARGLLRALAETLGQPPSVASLPELAARLDGRPPTLVVLDCCEPMLAAAATAAEVLLARLPQLQVLATSREPLAAAGEQVQAVGTMALPPRVWSPAVGEAMAYPAVRLFIDRAVAARSGRALAAGELPLALDICRQLEGIPLAIELAASAAGRFSMQELARRLRQDGRLALSAPEGRHQPRHRTLEAMLDWSHALLREDERLALGSLSVFRGSFTLEAGAALIGDDDPEQSETTLLDLVAKSLVATTRTDRGLRYRLLDLTREYAQARLRGPLRQQALRRHLALMLATAAALERQWETLDRRDWALACRDWLADIRAAIDNALACGASAAARQGIELTIHAYAIADHAGIAFEFEGRAREALRVLRTACPEDALLEARLVCAFPRIVHWDDAVKTGGDLVPLLRALGQVSRLGRPDLVVKPLIGLWVEALQASAYADAVGWSRQLRDWGSHDEAPVALLGSRLAALAQHFNGEHLAARRTAAFVRERGAHKLPFAFAPTAMDGAVSARIVLAREAWIGGDPAQAAEIAAEAVQLAGPENPFAECQAMGMASIPVALWSGDTDVARALVVRMTALATAHGLAYYRAWAGTFRDLLDLWLARGEPDLGRDHEPLPAPVVPLPLLADHLRSFDARLVTRDDAARVAAGTGGWVAAELSRGLALATAQRRRRRPLLRLALAQARAQQARAWELRVATSLARIEGPQPGRALLEPVLGRFPPGARTRDLRQARALLEAM